METRLSVLWGMYSEVELLDHMVVLVLILGGSSILFSIAAAPVLIPTNNAGAFFFLHILTDTHHFLGSVGL